MLDLTPQADRTTGSPSLWGAEAVASWSIPTRIDPSFEPYGVS